MQEHFNESYLESDNFQNHNSQGLVVRIIDDTSNFGTLKIHGDY